MRLAAPVLVLVACGSSPRPAPVTQGEAPAEPGIDDPAIARWRSLGLTGATWEAKLADLDVDDATRQAMARALLAGGDLACEDISEDDQCGQIVREMRPLAAAATFDDPCLRRALALWSVEQLAPEDAPALAATLLEMIALQDPETELQDAAFALLGDDHDDLRLALMAKADPERAEAQVSWLIEPAAVVHAATELHLTSAVQRLVSEDAARHHATLVTALTDELIASDARFELIGALEADGDQATVEALATVADEDDDCALAWAAASDLARRGDDSHLPARPAGTDARDHLRALCVVVASDLPDRDARIRAWIGAKGYDDVEYYDDVYWREDGTTERDSIDRDGDVTTEIHGGVTITTTHIKPKEVDVETLVRGVVERPDVSSWECTATSECVSYPWTIGFAAAGKSAVITTTRQDSYSGDDC